MRRFGASWDRPLLLSTVALLAVILFTAIAGTASALQAGLRGIAVAVTVFAAGTAIGSWAFAPQAFEIGGGALRFLRNGWMGHAIPLLDVRSAGEIAPDDLRGSVRLLGIGGLFGSYGLFRSAALGSYHLYATRTTGLVLVRTTTRVHVLTPDRPREFVEALLAAAPAARREGRAAAARR